MAISTRARRLVALRSFLRFAAREDWLPSDLGTTLDVPKLPNDSPNLMRASGSVIRQTPRQAAGG
ncbi:MAG TPA: hypothetical protein VFN75_05795 [Pseudonocardiaceae bacterium]|nr:hypothetical protein [Pseudonocardiaceae bacterium]